MTKIQPRNNDESLPSWVERLPEFFNSSTEITRDVSDAKRKQLIRKVAPRLYTTNLDRPFDELVAENALKIALLRHPGAVISHRSSLEMRPADGTLFLTGDYDASESVHALTIRLVRGPGPLEEDMPFLDGYRSSNTRAFVENLTPTRAHDVSRVLPREEIERRLVMLFDEEGRKGLTRLRKSAEALAHVPDFEQGAQNLIELIGSLLGTRKSELESRIAKARVASLPFDATCIQLFEVLAGELQKTEWLAVSRQTPPLLKHERQALAFIDAYFSNYIEGTQFLLEEAQSIVFDGQIPAHRPQDAHDIVGTYQLLVDESEMKTSLSNFDHLEDLEALLVRRHHTILNGRHEKNPGKFKQHRNRAGNTEFVAPELVQGTLEKGLLILSELETPFQRAAFAMFMITQIHPFDDGNGRLARATMNAELNASGEAHIIIATAYREDYLGALRRLSRNQDPLTYLRMLSRAHEYTSRLDFADFDALVDTLRRTNAFDDSGARILKLP